MILVLGYCRWEGVVYALFLYLIEAWNLAGINNE
jgi:hypothetical protein